MKSKDAVAIMGALSQETRLAVFRKLVAAGPRGLAAGQIAAAVKAPAPTLSFHLKELEHAGLAQQRRQGRSIIYTADFERMRALLTYLMADCCGGRPEICNIEIPACCP